MARYDVTKGVTSSYLVLNNDSMFVLKGGKAVNTTVNEYGSMYVSSGGIASDTTVNYRGSMTVFKGGKAYNANVSSGYFILSGGTINGLTIEKGSGCVSSGGGTINDLTLSGGFISFYSGTINRATVDHGDIYCYSGGKLNSATFNGGRLTVSSNCTANKITLENSAYMDVYQSKAKASGVQVKTGGSMYIGSGAVVSNITFEGGDADPAKDKYSGRLAAYGGTIKGLAIGSGTSVGLFEGCTATKVKWTPGDGVVNIWSASVSFTSKYSGVYVGSNGAFVSQSKELVSRKVEKGTSAYVAKGGVASGLDIASGGSVFIWNGGKALQTQIGIGESHSYMFVSSGGSAETATVFELGELQVYSGGKAGDVTICSGGYMYISRGTASGIKIESGGGLGLCYGTATDVEWTPFEGDLELWEGAQVTFADELSGVYIGTNGELTEQADEVSDRTLGQVEETWTKLTKKDEMYVMSDGKAERTAVGKNGSMYVFDGGSANETVLCDGGEAYVYYGGSARVVEVNDGWLAVYGGTAADVTLNGYMAVADGSAVNVTVGSGYYGYVYSGGILNSATLCSGGYRDGAAFYISSGGTASDLTLEYGACLYVSKGAKVTNISSSYGSYIEVEKGASVKKITAVEAWSPDCDYDKLNGWADKKKKTINDHIVDSTPTLITSDSYGIQIDENEASYYNNYVGYGDEIDFLKVRLDDAAKLSFGVTATDASKFTVWRWDDGKNKLVSLQASTLKLEEESYVKSGAKGSSLSKYYHIETKNLLLNAGDYYLSMESTNAAKGGNAYYNVYLYESVFFAEGNKADDDWATLPADYDFGALTRESQEIVNDEWVGYGDDIDYRKFTVAEGMTGSFDVYATDTSTKFTVYELVSKTKGGKTTESLKKLKSVTIKTFDEEYSCYRGITAACDFREGVEYYYSMESTNATKGGSAYYHVDFLLSEPLKAPAKFAQEESSLAAEDPSGSPALSFASLDADVLADASAFDKLAALDDASSWQSAAKLA